MNKNTGLCFLFLSLVICTMVQAGCAERSGERMVDDSYLSSDPYRKFQREVSGEQASRRQEGNTLKQVADSIYTNTKANTNGTGLTFPLKIDSVSIENYIRSGEEMPSRLQIGEYTYFSVGIFEKNGTDVLVFIIQKRTAGQNREVMLATVLHSGVKNVKTAALFRKSIPLNVNSSFVIDTAKRITVHTTRTRFYPIQQENTEHYRYLIRKDGTIRREIYYP